MSNPEEEKKKKKPHSVCWPLENLRQNSYMETHLRELAHEWEVEGSQRLPSHTNTDITWPRKAWSSVPTTHWLKDTVLWEPSPTGSPASPTIPLLRMLTPWGHLYSPWSWHPVSRPVFSEFFSFPHGSLQSWNRLGTLPHVLAWFTWHPRASVSSCVTWDSFLTVRGNEQWQQLSTVRWRQTHRESSNSTKGTQRQGRGYIGPQVANLAADTASDWLCRLPWMLLCISASLTSCDGI